MSEFGDQSRNGHAGREIARTATYMVLSRRQATSLFTQLLKRHERIQRLQRRNDSLHDQLDAEANLLVVALHELAVTKEKEPQHFIRQWLSTHRKEGGEAHVEAS